MDRMNITFTNPESDTETTLELVAADEYRKVKADLAEALREAASSSKGLQKAHQEIRDLEEKVRSWDRRHKQMMEERDALQAKNERQGEWLEEAWAVRDDHKAARQRQGQTILLLQEELEELRNRTPDTPERLRATEAARDDYYREKQEWKAEAERLKKANARLQERIDNAAEALEGEGPHL